MLARRCTISIIVATVSLASSITSLSAAERPILQRIAGSLCQTFRHTHRTLLAKSGLCLAIAAALSYRFDRSRLLWKMCGFASFIAYSQAIIDLQYAKRLLGMRPNVPKGMIICTNREHQLIPYERILFKSQGNVRVWGKCDNTGLSLLGEKDGKLLIDNHIWPADCCSHGVLPSGYIACVNRQHTFGTQYQQVVDCQVNDFSMRVLRSRAVPSKSVSIIGGELIVKDDVNNIRLQLPLNYCLHND